MSRLRIIPIVEGHGEQAAVRLLLTRIWTELLGGEYVEILRPIRRPRSQLVQEKDLNRAIDLAILKLKEKSSEDPGMVLLLIDADKDPPCQKGPELERLARKHRTNVDIACVLAHPEYETWFVASAESLGDYLDIDSETSLPQAPEEQYLRKGWIEHHFRGPKYSETVDQAAMTAVFDLALCRQRSPSFDKLCSELEKRL